MKNLLFLILLCISILVNGLSINNQKNKSIIKGKYFDRVVIIIFENQKFIVANKDPYLKSLVNNYNGILLTNYQALTHPSQPNYIGLISGSTKGTNGDNKSNLYRKSIIDLLETKNISWKTYQEDYPGKCNKKMDIGNYARKHNPFISFMNIQNSKKRCSKIVNSKFLDKDIENNTVPQFIFYTPNIKNDAHDTSMKYASNWLKGFLEIRIIKTNFNKNTMFVITFDEDDGSTNNNRVYTSLFGPDFHHTSKSKVDNTKYNHYSLLKIIEENWKLGNLNKNDKKAILIKL